MKSVMLLIVSIVCVVGSVSASYQCFKEFECEDRCITYSYRCDGEVDCPIHAEDEADCEYICPYQTHHRCSDTGLCMDNHHLCDGFVDCPNGEDETQCHLNTWTSKRGAKVLPVDDTGLRMRATHDHEGHFYEQNGIRVVRNETAKNSNEQQPTTKDELENLLYAKRVIFRK